MNEKKKRSRISGKKSSSESDDEKTLSPGNKESCASSSSTSSQCYALRTTRKNRMIKLGWICNGVYVQEKFGGGTRQISAPKLWRKNELKIKCFELFFPNGVSVK